MKRLVTMLIAACAGLAVAAGSATAHHSYAMFDMENGVEVEGTVKQFKWTSPHSFIVLVVKGSDGAATAWNLEGAPTEGLARAGWTRDTLKPGEALKMTIFPLRSGAPGGAWLVKHIRYLNGDPVGSGRTDVH